MNHTFSYSRGNRSSDLDFRSGPFGQYCTTAEITDKGHLKVNRYDDLNFSLIQDRDLTNDEFEQLNSLITAWEEESSTYGSQSKDTYGIRYWDKSAYWTDPDQIQGTKLRQLAFWLRTHIFLL